MRLNAMVLTPCNGIKTTRQVAHGMSHLRQITNQVSIWVSIVLVDNPRAHAAHYCTGSPFRASPATPNRALELASIRQSQPARAGILRRPSLRGDEIALPSKKAAAASETAVVQSPRL